MNIKFDKELWRQYTDNIRACRCDLLSDAKTTGELWSRLETMYKLSELVSLDMRKFSPPPEGSWAMKQALLGHGIGHYLLSLDQCVTDMVRTWDTDTKSLSKSTITLLETIKSVTLNGKEIDRAAEITSLYQKVREEVNYTIASHTRNVQRAQRQSAVYEPVQSKGEQAEQRAEQERIKKRRADDLIFYSRFLPVRRGANLNAEMSALLDSLYSLV